MSNLPNTTRNQLSTIATLATQELTPGRLELYSWPVQPSILVIAPHPDDFDAIACTLKYMQVEQQANINLLVLSGGSKGVQDEYDGNGDWHHKAWLREQEQRTSVAQFGLATEQIRFLRLPEAADGELSDCEANRLQLFDALSEHSYDIFMLPYGEDSNTAHQRTFAMACDYARLSNRPMLGLFNKDAKTTHFRADLYQGFDAASARWKAGLLRCHDTQQRRNLNLRGHGFDDRVLNFNRQVAEELGLDDPFAEAFQVSYFPPA